MLIEYSKSFAYNSIRPVTNEFNKLRITYFNDGNFIFFCVLKTNFFNRIKLNIIEKILEITLALSTLKKSDIIEKNVNSNKNERIPTIPY